jgi:multiple sugar transport system substrate-binding protein
MDNQGQNPGVPPVLGGTTNTYEGGPPPGSPEHYGAAPAPQLQSQPAVNQGSSGARKLPKNLLPILIGISVTVVAMFLIIRFVVPLFSGPREVSITWWGLWEPESVVAPIISEYEAANPGVSIEYKEQSKEDYRERLVNALAGGTGPDIFRFHNTWYSMFSDELSTAPANLISIEDYSATYYPTAVSTLTGTDGIFGIPLEYDAITLFINEDIFTGAGKNPPHTWNELRDLARSLTIKDERGVITQSGVALGRTENVDHWQEILALMMLQNRANLNSPTGELAEAALTFYTNFAKVDKVWDATLPPSTVAFANGKVAMYFGPSWRVHEILAQNPNLKFRSVPLPQLPKDSPDEPDVSYANYWAEGVWEKSKVKDEAWKFLKFMSEKETQEKFFANASAIRGFGEPYPRVDMANLLNDHPILGSIVALAPEAKTWFLQDRTYDGPTGINSLIGTYYENAVNAVNNGTAPAAALVTVAQGVQQVLSGR